jgi:rubrerythrin
VGRAEPVAAPRSGDRWRAWVCRVCPFCVAARAFPGSAYARALAAAERKCPFCLAHARVNGKG